MFNSRRTVFPSAPQLRSSCFYNNKHTYALISANICLSNVFIARRKITIEFVLAGERSKDYSAAAYIDFDKFRIVCCVQV